MSRLIVALTGASGAIYGRRLLQRLVSHSDVHIDLVLSAAAVRVLNVEDRLALDLARPDELLDALIGADRRRVTWHPVEDIGASIASGSFRTLGMAVVPCSMGTLGSIAHGISRNLVERAADVCLKERRTLVLMPRETPLSLIHLENMVALTRAGAIIMPASPGFYTRPERVEELLDFMVARVFSHFDLPCDFAKRWE